MCILVFNAAKLQNALIEASLFLCGCAAESVSEPNKCIVHFSAARLTIKRNEEFNLKSCASRAQTAAFLVSVAKRWMWCQAAKIKEKELNKIVIWMGFCFSSSYKRRSMCVRVFVADAVAMEHVNDFSNRFAASMRRHHHSLTFTLPNYSTFAYPIHDNRID